MEINLQRPLMPSATLNTTGTTGAAEKVVRPFPAPTRVAQNTASSGSAAAVKTLQANEKKLQRAVEDLQRRVQVSASNLHFSIDQDTGRTVVKVTDVNTHEVIRQIPQEEILHLDQALERMWGLLLDKQG